MTNTERLVASYIAASYAVNATAEQASAARTYAPPNMHQVSATRAELVAAAERYDQERKTA